MSDQRCRQTLPRSARIRSREAFARIFRQSREAVSTASVGIDTMSVFDLTSVVAAGYIDRDHALSLFINNQAYSYTLAFYYDIAAGWIYPGPGADNCEITGIAVEFQDDTLTM